MKANIIEQEAGRFSCTPLPALSCSRARAPARESAANTETGRADAVLPRAVEAGAWRSLPQLAFGPVSRPPLVLHSSGSYGYRFDGRKRGPTAQRWGSDPGEVTTRGRGRSDIPPTGGRIPGCAGAPALRLEWVLRSRTASKHPSPAPAPGIPVRNAA